MDVDVHVIGEDKKEAPQNANHSNTNNNAIDVDVDVTDSPPRRNRNSNRIVVPAESYEPSSPMGLRRRRQRKRDLPSQEEEEEEQAVEDDDDDDDDDDILQVSDVVDLVSPRRSSQPPTPDDDDDKEEWPCPQCTLLNSTTQVTCGACHYRNPDITARRPANANPTRSGRSIGESNNNNVSPLAFVSGGALLGSVLGAAGNFMQGRDPFSGAAEGAMTGVVGGAFLNEVLRSPNVSTTASENRNNNIAQARSSAAMGMAGYPSIGSNSNSNSNNQMGGNRRARPRSSYRVVRQQGADGTTTTIITGGNGSTRITRSSTLGDGRMMPEGINDPMLSLLLHSYLQQGGAGGAERNVEGMDYEQLLQAFGDGSENMGADERQIVQLPTRLLENPETELPEDARQCSICLEDFCQGETRKTLPCLHGFHQHCADKWLRTNGSCPICKHKLS
jgi:hypothetical protein